MAEPIITDEKFHHLYEQTQNPGNPFYEKTLLAQAKHETGNFSSQLARNHNNLFGMAPAKVRDRFYENVTNSSEGPKASYATQLASIQDRIDLDIHNGIEPPQDEDDIERYINEVQNAGYATDPNYLQRWRQWLMRTLPGYGIFEAGASVAENQIGKMKKTGTIVAIVVLLVLGVFVYRKFRK